MSSTVRDSVAETAALRHLSVRFSPRAEDTVVAAIDGELDLYTAPLLQATLLPLPATGVCHIVVDARELLFCDVCGFRTLSEVNDMAVDHGGELVITRPNRSLRRIATLVQEMCPDPGSQPIPLFDDLEEPLDNLIFR
ncbi:STAS domain-containing protein [Herbidospora mongoliensis]|uniref:STAS domain-containing protein n=1 Tax=Herbidospora mongoliensis TaxID=688067 RepID=UPI000A030CB2|nr:STAS domain-containing protein [Herbidospora mongoliensis]